LLDVYPFFLYFPYFLYSYDGSNHIRRVQDAFGRISTFTVDTSGNLTRRIAPDGGITTLVYGASNLLVRYIDPLGNRTSFAYDANNFIKTIQTPNGATTNYDYTDWLTTKVTDQAGKLTTVLHNIRRNIAGIIDPLGKRTTYLWTGSFLQGMIDPNGNRTTFTYANLVNGTKRLATVQDPTGSRFTITYDGNDRVQRLTDQRGTTSTLTWDSSNNRTGLRRLAEKVPAGTFSSEVAANSYELNSLSKKSARSACSGVIRNASADVSGMACAGVVKSPAARVCAARAFFSTGWSPKWTPPGCERLPGGLGGGTSTSTVPLASFTVLAPLVSR
jgi:YD repeat-containing protein